MNSAIEIMTGFGGDWLVPSAFRIIPKTIAKRTKDVVDIKKNGAILIDEIDSSKLIDELNCNGSVNEFKSILNSGVWAIAVNEITDKIILTIFIMVICQLMLLNDL